jgi:hypothetical protein
MSEEVREKVTTERDELEIKLKKLAAFIYNNDAFKKINPKQQKLLKKQLVVMDAYLDILNERLEVG